MGFVSPKTYTNPVYLYQHSPDQDSSAPTHHRVIIVGAGPAGLSAALELALQGIPTVVLDDNNTVSVGSRAICFSKRTLEICDRYGCAAPMVQKGITWKLGKVFNGDRLIYEFNLLPEEHHKMPAFINLQQYYFEEYMVNRCQQFDCIDLRWLHKVTKVVTGDHGTQVEVETQDGIYTMTCDYLLVADGANSPIRAQLGLESKGQVFEDRFLIADVVMEANLPTERRFWFNPPFHSGQSTLLHRQADNVWRIDFQLGWDADPEVENTPEKILPRIQAMLGKDVEFELEWSSVYTFRCRMMDSFIHHRVYFIGDAAHQVSPFGARGANGGIQGVENLCWKLAKVLKQEAPSKLLETYDIERQYGAKENILNSSRATDFMTPKNKISKTFRNETLKLAARYPFARSLVNSGRLSLPCIYEDSPLNTKDVDAFADKMRPGSPAADASIECISGEEWLLECLGNRFICMIAANVDENQSNPLLQAIATLRDSSPDIALLLVDAPEGFSQYLREDDKAIKDSLGLI
ncbi:MAG: FAD-dependent oxidoreductase, partial [Pseudomonadales bacterium]|nr:FAD-dependent oxidoreductase [Pseudomonadales bacterium]